MKEKFSRRAFLRAGAVAAGGLTGANIVLLDPSPLFASSRPQPPSDRVRCGFVGVGMQGSGLLDATLGLGVECIAVADLYDGRHTLAREITRSPKLRTTRRYQELLDDKEIDCIVAAVPDHWHRKIVVDAISAGKDIYCEKPMSHNAADGIAMVDAAQRYNRIVQIGSQRVSSQLCRKARERLSRRCHRTSCRWWNCPWAATIPQAPGNIRHRLTFRRPLSIGRRGSGLRQRSRLMLTALPAGAAGRSTVRA